MPAPLAARPRWLQALNTVAHWLRGRATARLLDGPIFLGPF
jgi:hypothetical protein